MGLAVKGLFWLGPFGLLQCVSVWGQGLQCYDCDGQTMGIPTDDCWTNFNASTRVRITEATDPTKCLVCYTEIIDVMINATTRNERVLKRRCLTEMADKDDFDKLPNKNACGVFMPIKKLDAAYSKDGDFQQTERCYCMSNKCNTWQVKDRRTGIVQQEKSAFSTDNAGNTANSDDPEKPASETPGNATGTDSGGLSGISSASSVKFGHAGMGEPSFYRFLWPSVLVVMVHVVRSLLCPADTS